VLLVDDDEDVRRGYARCIARTGYDVDQAASGLEALSRLAETSYDAVVSDIRMPGLSGVELLKSVRERDLDVPVVLMTGDPSVESAARAIEYGALQYLLKPIEPAELRRSVVRAVQLHRMTLAKLRAADLTGNTALRVTDRVGLHARLDSALRSLWMVFQPVVRVEDGSVFGFEALLRCNEPALPHPGAVVEAAERLGRLAELGQTTRARAAEAISTIPTAALFVNLHPRDLFDPDLLDPAAALTQLANRVVLEITERASLETNDALKQRIVALRALGYRIAIDDLGAGYSGLTSFALLEPELIKFDMSLVRDVHGNRTKQRLIRSMTRLAKELGILTVAEGVELREERDCLIELGCDLLQGYLLARPAKDFPLVNW
jgi:EAL domain-containing protein (putative c-di-GMP-specific phosphodiesterase class I)